MASNNRKAPPRWPPKNADDRNRHAASRAQTGGSLHAKRRIDSKKVQETLDDMFINTFDSEIIRSVAHSCGWKLNKSIEALIMLAEGSEFPNNKFGSSSFQSCALSERERNEMSWAPSTSRSVKDSLKTDKIMSKESCNERAFSCPSSSASTPQHLKKKSVVMNASQGTIKVAYKGHDDLSDDDEDADVVIEEENEFEVSELDFAFAGASSQSLYQFLTPFVSTGQSCNENRQSSLENTVKENNPPHKPSTVSIKSKQTSVDLLHSVLDKSPPKMPVKKTKHWPKFERVKKQINDGIKVMVMMRGCSGSGKSSLARHIIKSTYGGNEQKFIFSTDNYFVNYGGGKYLFNPRLLSYAHQWNQQQVDEEAKKGTNPIIVDNTNLEAWEMEPYVRIAVEFGYNVEFLEPRTSWRYNSLELERKGTHNVPRRTIEDMLVRFERDLTPARVFSLFNLRYSLHNAPPQYISQEKSAEHKDDSSTCGVKKKLKVKKRDEGENSIKSASPIKNDLPKPLQLSGVLGSDVADQEIKESLDVLLSEWNHSVMAQSNKKLNHILSETTILNQVDDTKTVQDVSAEHCTSYTDQNLCDSSDNVVRTGRDEQYDQNSNNFCLIDTEAGGDDVMDFMSDSTDISEEGEEMKFAYAADELEIGSEEGGNLLSLCTAIPVCNKTEDSMNLENVESNCMEYVMVLEDGTLLPQKSYLKENNTCQSKESGRKWEYLLMTDDSKLLFHPAGNKSSEEVCAEGNPKSIIDIPENNALITISKDTLDLDESDAVPVTDSAASPKTKGEKSSLDYLLFEDEEMENVKSNDPGKTVECTHTGMKTSLEAKLSGMDLLIANSATLLNLAFTGVGDSPSGLSFHNPPEVETRKQDAWEKGPNELTFSSVEEAAVNCSSDEQTNVQTNPQNSTPSETGKTLNEMKIDVSEECENSKLFDWESLKEEVSLGVEKIESSSEVKEETNVDLMSFISLCQENQNILTKDVQACSSLSINDAREKDILETWEEGTSWDELETNTTLVPKIIDSSTPKPARNIRRQGGMEFSPEKCVEKKVDARDVDNLEQWAAVEESVVTWEENKSVNEVHEKLPERNGPQPQRKMFAKGEEDDKNHVEEPQTLFDNSKFGRKEELIFLQPVSLSDVLLSNELECGSEVPTGAKNSITTDIIGSETTDKKHESALPDLSLESTSDAAGCSYLVDSILKPKKNVLHSSTNTHHADFITLGDVNMRSLDAAPGVKILHALSRDIIDNDALGEGMREIKKIGPILMLDKSSMTYDIVSSPPEIENVKEQLHELVKMFPNCRVEDLLEIFEKCNRDINWTVDLLLESACQGIEISTPNSTRGKDSEAGIVVEINTPLKNSEISEMVDNACSTNNGSVSNSCIATESLSLPSNSPQVSSASTETCAKSTLPNKRSGKKDRTPVSETSLLLKKQLEENIVINEEHYSDHVSRIRKLRHGELVEIAGSSQEGGESLNINSLQENFVNLSSDEFLLQQMNEVGAASAYALRPDAPEWGNNDPDSKDVTEEHEEEETVFLKMDSSFAEQLHSLFGTPSLPFDQDMKPTMNLPLSLARQLHSYMMEAEQNMYDLMMQEDEEFARKLQLQDDREIAEAAAATGNHVPDLREIMDMEMALAMYKADQKHSRNESKEDLATKLTKNLLCEWFPSLPKDILMNVFEAHNNSFEDTLEVLLASTEEDSSVRVVMTEEARAAHEKALLKKANLEGEKNKENVRPYSAEKEKVTSEEALEDANYYRSEASRHYSLRNECQSKAQKAYQRGHTAVAAYYSQMALLHKERIEENNARAASSLLLAHSLGNLNTTLDLHFLYVVEALQVLDMFLDHHINNLLETSHRTVAVFVITGRGARSSGGRSRIKPAVVQRLEQRGLRHEEVNPGLLKVFITRNASSSAKMMSC